MKAKKFRPGQRVPESGIYRVEHNSHRLMHEAALLEKDLFPRCRKCRSAVRFQLVRALNDNRILPFRSSAILESVADHKLASVELALADSFCED